MPPGVNHPIIGTCSFKSSGDTKTQPLHPKLPELNIVLWQLQDKSTVFHPEPPPKPHLLCILRRGLLESNITLLLD